MKRKALTTCAALMAAVFASSAAAQSGGGYEITRSAIGPAGVSSGGGYEAGAIIGQPDPEPMTGGGYTATSGFWEPPGPSPIPTVSEWGLLILALSLLIGVKVMFRRRTAQRT